jgi:Ala-tRNA(Pro) deacylase
MRVPQYLIRQQVPFETIVHAPVFSAQKRAKFLHLPGKQVAKIVLLAGPEDYLLAVLPATHHIDLDALAAALGGPVRMADGREIARVFNDCEWGAALPFGTLYGLPTVLDASVDPDATLTFEGHTHSETIRMRCRDFERLERPVRLRFAFPGTAPDRPREPTGTR